MAHVILAMFTQVIATGLEERLLLEDGIEVELVNQLESIVSVSDRNRPDLIIMETTAFFNGYSIADCIRIRNTVKESNPDCRILFAGNNLEGTVANDMIVARKQGLIDGFLHMNLTINYWLDTIKSFLP